MTIRFATLAAAAALSLCASFAVAQTPAAKPAPAPAAAPAATPAPAAKPAKPAAKPRTAKSLQCSKDADAKNIHGKARKKFMSECKRGKPTG